MPSRFDSIDPARIRTISIAERRSKVSVDDVVDPLAGPRVDADALRRMLPDVLAARSLVRVADALRRARRDGREILWMFGAHVIKTGLSLYLRALVERGWASALASTGSSVIHDLELAFHGATSEDVAAELPAGRFGMARETAAHVEAAIRRADAEALGLGEAVGAYVREASAPHARVSVFAAASQAGIPATVHVAFGTDIVHPHPGFPAREAGEATMRDFRIVAERVRRLFDRGVVVVLGSAVILPEVFLKAVSVAYNLGAVPRDVTAASFDMMPQYRVRENVLSRPFRGACEAHAVTGHHEILVPLLWALLGEA